MTTRTIRQALAHTSTPIVAAMLSAIRRHAERTGQWMTLLAVCPNSEAVLKAALVAARDYCAPMLFAATLNQVDTDGGYTGWWQRDFVDFTRAYSREIGFTGTAVCCLDHGGPWLKDRQRQENYTYEQAMQGVKDSLAACLDAGYELLHIDPTVDARLGAGEVISIHDVAQRTLVLIAHAERHRHAHNLPRVSYEVGTEEVHGGLADMTNFTTLLNELSAGLTALGYTDAMPVFVVGKVGTDLHTTEFDADVASALSRVAARYGSVIKGHYSDGVANPQAYPLARMGGANVGPEFTEVEHDTLVELGQQNPSARIGQVLQDAVERSGRWRKWLIGDEVGRTFADLSLERRAWLTRTGCRYIWTDPQVLDARQTLYRNLSTGGVDAVGVIISAIAARIAHYFRAFNLVGAEETLAVEIEA